jgi:hypothetical protein
MADSDGLSSAQMQPKPAGGGGSAIMALPCRALRDHASMHGLSKILWNVPRAADHCLDTPASKLVNRHNLAGWCCRLFRDRTLYLPYLFQASSLP